MIAHVDLVTEVGVLRDVGRRSDVVDPVGEPAADRPAFANLAHTALIALTLQRPHPLGCLMKRGVAACSARPSPHHALDGEGALGPGESFSRRLTRHRSHGRRIDGQVLVKPSASIVSAVASAAVAWAVWPSCQRNSLVRRNILGRSLFASWRFWAFSPWISFDGKQVEWHPRVTILWRRDQYSIADGTTPG